MEREIWRDIKGYEGLYQISNLGRIRKYIILKQFLSHRGYLTTQLSKKNKSKTFLVHRLVAKTFIPKINDKNQVNHKDGNKTNNKVENLEWCTNKENNTHAWKNGLMKRVVENNKKEVAQYTKEGKLVKVWSSITEASNSINGSFSAISACCRHKPYAKTAYGYKWEFANKELLNETNR